MKFCKDCANYYEGTYSSPLCRSKNVGYNLVNGDLNRKYAQVMRLDFRDNRYCGSEARWFVPIRGIKVENPTKNTASTESPTLWQKIKAIFS